MATKTVYQTAFDDATADYNTMNVATLRKMASGKVKGGSRLQKTALVAELAKLHAQEVEKTTATPDAKARKAKETTPKRRTAKTQPKGQIKAKKAASDHENAPKTKPGRKVRAGDGSQPAKGKCEFCGVRPIDRKTQGRDSTMCGPCFDYAGWENTHADNGHEGQGQMLDSLTEDVAAALAAEMENCPVCQGNNPANKPARKNGSVKGRKVARQQPRKQGQSKAQRFAEVAKENGWKPRIETAENGHLEIVTAHAAGGEYVQIQWRDGACLNTGTTHKRTDGKTVKVRNASAAYRILQSA